MAGTKKIPPPGKGGGKMIFVGVKAQMLGWKLGVIEYYGTTTWQNRVLILFCSVTLFV